MSEKRQTSYDVLKTTFGFFPMELRESLVRRCPEVRQIDKIIPYLEFGYVSLNEYSFTIDDRQFEFRVVSDRAYQRYQVFHRTIIKNITLNDVPKMITADDIVIRDLRSEELRARWEAERQEDRARRPGFGGAHREVDGEELRRYENSRYLEMKLKTSDDVFIKRFDDKYQFPILMRKLLASYFDKNGVIPVKHLAIEDSEGVFRLPPNLKMHVRELSLPKYPLNSSAVLNGFEKIFSLPLERINFKMMSSNDPVLEHPVVRSAARLNILNAETTIMPGEEPRLLDDELTNAFARLENSMVELCEFHVSVANLITLAERWIEARRGTASVMLVAIWQYDMVLDVLDALVQNQGAVRGRLTGPEFSSTFYRNCVTVPMGENMELNVHGCTRPTNEVKYPLSCQPYFFRMEVMKKGSAVPTEQDD